MTTKRIGVLALGIAIIGFGIWLGHVGRRPVTNPAPIAESRPVHPLPLSISSGSHWKVSAPTVAPRARDVALGYEAAFRISKNYLEFIQGSLAAAKKGDRDAEYYISAAIAYCDETNRFFFKKRNRTLSVDEAITYRERFPGPSMTAAIRRADERCRDVNATSDPAWGTADPWLAKAAAAGQPVAEIKEAERMLLAIVTSGTPGTVEPGTTGQIFTASDARSLVKTAVETNSPEVIFEMGDLLGLFNKTMVAQEGANQGDEYQQVLTWRYAACLRGLECDADAEWHNAMCLSDPSCRPGETGIDYLLRNAREANVNDLEQRAEALNVVLDGKSWDQLGLGG